MAAHVRAALRCVPASAPTFWKGYRLLRALVTTCLTRTAARRRFGALLPVPPAALQDRAVHHALQRLPALQRADGPALRRRGRVPDGHGRGAVIRRRAAAAAKPPPLLRALLSFAPPARPLRMR